MILWTDLGGLHYLRSQPSLPPQLRRRLTQLGFSDTIDRLIVAIALCTTDRHIVSEDSDFWDPRDPGRKGDPRAPVATLLDRDATISVRTLQELFRHVPAS